jgi:hypothetical protein
MARLGVLGSMLAVRITTAGLTAMSKAMSIERDETDTEWPTEADPIHAAICSLIVTVFELTAPDSPERKAAMNEVLAAGERIKQALAPKPRPN